jgi:CheY-like chemotaxis protein
MVQILLVIDDPLVRDQILVGTRHVRGVKTEAVEETSALEWIRQGSVDCVFLEHNAAQDPSMERLREFRELGPEVEFVIVSDARTAKQLQKERGDSGIDTVIATPLTADAFFRLVGRLVPRLKRKKQRLGA